MGYQATVQDVADKIFYHFISGGKPTQVRDSITGSVYLTDEFAQWLQKNARRIPTAHLMQHGLTTKH